MGWEDSLKHLLGLNYQNLQALCKQYNLPANKSRSELATSIAMLLEVEKENLNSRPGRAKLNGSAEAPPATAPALLHNNKETPECGQDSRKRESYSDRDNDDRSLLQVKHIKGPQTEADEALASQDFGTQTSLPPVSTDNGKADGFSPSCSGQGIASNVKSQSADGVATKSTPPEVAIRSHDSTAQVNENVSLLASYPSPNVMVSEPCSHQKVGEDVIGQSKGHTEVGEDVVEKGKGSSDKTSANSASPFQFYVMDDKGFDLVVDLDSTPSAWFNSYKGEVSMPPNTHRSEPGRLCSYISSLASKDYGNTISPSGNIIMDTENKGADTVNPCTNASLCSTVGEDSRSKPYPPDATPANSGSCAPTLPGTLVEISGSKEGVPMVRSSCLTSDVQNNLSVDMVAGASDSNVLAHGSVNGSLCPEKIPANLAGDFIQPTSNKDTSSPGKIKVPVLVAGNDEDAALCSGRSGSDENSPPASVGKQEMLRAQLTRNSDTDDVLMENNPDRCVAGNFNLKDPVPSSAASENAAPLTPKHDTKTAQNHDSVENKRLCDPEELQHSVPTRNILFSLRSAARLTQPSTRRRSARLIPK